MNDTPETQTVVVSRVFDAPIDLVYDAWTKAEHVVDWMKCSPDVTTTLEAWTPARDSTFRYRMKQEGVFEATTTGRFLEVDPPNVLSYVMDANPEIGAPEMTVRIVLEELDQGTKLTLTHSGLPTDFCGMIEAGWTVSLDLLKDVVIALFGAYAGARMPSRAKPLPDAQGTES
jgi:uncharacterized protein YndB with AHSA1/START domain